MKEISASAGIIELDPEGLVIVWLMEPSTDIVTIVVNEHKLLTVNPNPTANQNHLAKYSICQNCFNQVLGEVQKMFQGWSRIDRTMATRLIGIHNQDPQTLYIQFTLGQRYFIYERCLTQNREIVSEELFGRKHSFRQRGLNSEDELYLISNLRFIPKTRKAINAYPQTTHTNLTHLRSQLHLPCSC